MSRFLIILLIFSLGCRKKDDGPAVIIDEQTEFPVAAKYTDLNCPVSTNQIDTVKMMIAGTYEWAYSHFYQRGSPMELWTPANKPQYRYVFKPDGWVEYYVDKKRRWTNRYYVDHESRVTGRPQDLATIIFIQDSTGGRLLSDRIYLCNDSAVLKDWLGSFLTIKHFSRK